MNQESSNRTPDQQGAQQAKFWRENQHEGDKANSNKQRAEYRASRALISTIDEKRP